MNSRVVLFLLAIAVISVTLGPAPYAQPSQDLTPEGPYIDRIVFRVIRNRDVSLLALEKGEIDLIAGFVDPKQVPRLLQNPNIGIAQAERRGFGQLSFNTAKFPGNIPEFRQAVAYALDKNRISTEAWGGLARSVDSSVPPSLGVWSYEDQFPEHYYDPNPTKAIELLEKAGFVDVDNDGIREYKGAKFRLEVFGGTGTVSGEAVLSILKENMKAVGIDVTFRFLDASALFSRTEAGKFALAFFGLSVGLNAGYLIDWFKCGRSSNELLWRYCNPQLDEVLLKMENAESFEEAVKWAWEAQKILWKEQPIIIVYVNLLISAYRTDRFEGYLNVPAAGVENLWTYTKIRPKGAALGGELKVSIPTPVGTNNVLSTVTGFEVLENVYDPASGIARNPFTLAYIPYLAQQWQLGKTAEGGLDLTIRYYPNIKWHDGVPFSAEDVKFSYELQQKIRAPFIIDYIQSIDKVEVMDPLSIRIHSTKSGYFEFSRIQVPWLLPKHVWETIPLQDVLSYPNQQPIGTGPFMLEQAVPGEFYVLAYFKDGIWVPSERGGKPPTQSLTSITASENATTHGTSQSTLATPILTGTVSQPAPTGVQNDTLLVAGAAVIVALVGVYVYRRSARRKQSL